MHHTPLLGSSPPASVRHSRPLSASLAPTQTGLTLARPSHPSRLPTLARPSPPLQVTSPCLVLLPEGPCLSSGASWMLAEPRNPQPTGQHFGGLSWLCLSQGLDTGEVTHPGIWFHSHFPYYHGFSSLWESQSGLPSASYSMAARLTVSPVFRRVGHKRLPGRTWNGDPRALSIQGTLRVLNSLYHPVPTSPIPNPIFLSTQLPRPPPSIQDTNSSTYNRSPGSRLSSRPCVLTPQPAPGSSHAPSLSHLDWPLLSPS